jgi:hypothetical protein
MNRCLLTPNPLPAGSRGRLRSTHQLPRRPTTGTVGWAGVELLARAARDATGLELDCSWHDAVMVKIVGSPIGGENPPHDRIWRSRVAEAAVVLEPARAVALHFRVEPHRRVDLDNLVRPALAGLRDAGVFTRGFANLDLLVATKTALRPPGLVVVTDEESVRNASARPGPSLLHVTSMSLPRDGNRGSRPTR